MNLPNEYLENYDEMVFLVKIVKIRFFMKCLGKFVEEHWEY